MLKNILTKKFFPWALSGIILLILIFSLLPRIYKPVDNSKNFLLTTESKFDNAEKATDESEFDNAEKVTDEGDRTSYFLTKDDLKFKYTSSQNGVVTLSIKSHNICKPENVNVIGYPDEKIKISHETIAGNISPETSRYSWEVKKGSKYLIKIHSDNYYNNDLTRDKNFYKTDLNFAFKKLLETDKDDAFKIEFDPLKTITELRFPLTQNSAENYFVLTAPQSGEYRVNFYSKSNVQLIITDSLKKAVEMNLKKNSFKNFGTQFNVQTASFNLEKGASCHISIIGQNILDEICSLNVVKPQQSLLAGLIETRDINGFYDVMNISAVSQCTNLNEFIIPESDAVPERDIISREMINGITFSQTGTNNINDLNIIKSQYKDKIVEASYSHDLNYYASAKANYAIELINNNNSIKVWFTLPQISVHPLAKEYINPYKNIIEKIKNKMNKHNPYYWENNVAGFYWGSEEIPQWYTSFDPNNIFANPMIATMNELSNTIHSKYHKKFLWIPFFGAKNINYENSKRIGYIANKTDIFDYVVLQLGYFYKPLSENNIEHTLASFEKNQVLYPDKSPVCDKTSKTQIGVEMEIDYAFADGNEVYGNDTFNSSETAYSFFKQIITGRFNKYIDAIKPHGTTNPIVFYKVPANFTDIDYYIGEQMKQITTHTQTY